MSQGMGEKTDGGKSKRKRYIDYSQVSSAKRSKREKIQNDMRGILVTCNNGNEGKATRESYDLCNEFYSDDSCADVKIQDGIISNDLSGELERELNELKSSPKLKPFKSINSGAKNIVFIRFNDVEISPSQLVERVFDDFLEKKQPRTRFIEKFIPISLICRADLLDIKKNIPLLLKQNSELLKEKSTKKYTIYYKCRNNNDICRTSVIEMVNLAIIEEKCNLWASHSNPTIGLIIEIIASKCCMGLVRHYAQYAKYNINELCQKFSKDTGTTDSTKPQQTSQAVPSDESEDKCKSKKTMAVNET